MEVLRRISRWPAVRWLWEHPRIALLILSTLVIWRVILLGHLTYGDIPYFDVTTSKVNFLYAWGAEQLGSPVRQSLNTLRDAVLLMVSPLSIMYYAFKYIMPIVLIPQVYYWIFSRLGLRSKPVLLMASLFPLFTPIVFGDFLTGQTFWVYLTLPFVFFYAIKIFALQQFTLRNDVLLALWLFFSLGMLPPIIVPLLAVVAVFASVMLLVHTDRHMWTILGRFIISGVRIGVLFGALALPYLLIASSGQAAYTSPSLLGDYYHNYADTNLFNTLRMAGNNGSGQSTLDYNQWSVTNLFGYVIAALMIGGGIMIGLRQRLSRYWIVVIGLLAVLLAVLGFMQLLTINTLFGIKVFESQWVVSTVRNPSKLYAILLPIFALLFAFGLGNILQRYGKSPKTHHAFLIGVAIVVAIYGWPALRGDLGLFAGREESVSSYRQDPVVQQIAKSPAAQDGRALLMPANHRDELNYEFLNPNLNVLRLEGSLPGSAKTVDALNDALNDRNPYFFNYLDALGVKTLFVKKDPTAYKAALFDLFSVRLDPEQTKGFLQSKLKLTHQTETYWEFHNAGASDLVYSPSNLTYIEQARARENNAPFYGKDAAVVTDVFKTQAASVTRFKANGSIGGNQTIRSGKAQLHDPTLVVADIHRADNQAIIETISPLHGLVEKTIRIPLGTSGDMVSLGESDFIVTDQKQRVTMRAGDYRALISKLEPVSMAGSDTSFETLDAWKAEDSTPTAKGEASIYTSSKSDRTEGARSLALHSESHRAFVSLPLPVSDRERRYVLQFDYKNVTGAAASFGIYQGKQNLLAAEGGLAKINQWQTQTIFFSPDETNGDALNFFFYTEGSERAPSENLIDHFRLYQVIDGDAVPASVSSYPPDYDLKDYHPTQTNNPLEGQNLLTNASFENGSLWGPVGDATSGAKGKPVQSVSQSADKSHGLHSLELHSRNHTAYVARKTTRFASNAVYKLSFDYKHIAGRAPAFAVWQDGAAVSKPSGELRGHSGWNHYESYFVPEAQANNLTVFFYSRSNGERTTNLYDNVRLELTSLVSTYLSEESAPAKPTQPIVESFTRINPTMIKVTMRPGAGMLVFNESFHKGWKAYIVPSGKVSGDLQSQLMISDPGTLIPDHQTVNGFANGWWIDPARYPGLSGQESYTVLLRYEPQKMLYSGLGVMGGALVITTGYLSYGWWRERRDR